MPNRRTLRICPKGHKYFKSSDCPTCPVCEQENKPGTGFLSLLSAPARRALQHAAINDLARLATCTEKEILALHGIGPSAMPILRKALKAEGLSFRKL
ncbi:RNA polymerase alpha subunit C-terminal domain-containing protein [Paraflavitalea sp. CAU 1676]|uniref:RNA polymerase alpha subunit C-terminal domain-containing protein n=1 Tax=Paraflavitalea sp. CAU 1676 TaxID=3032598 RepID=UPI0023DADAB7|nr:RNA polymerase alpha subunit C-terminal domain-containing protein [Paraflavitalea sp. CAU 1676]MDF2188821.1 RNA polymerase alpha subunit C-terminal domain-containing protein [Paraflavitalea sp. CAU 1676]